MQVEYVLQAALTLQADSPLAQVLTIFTLSCMHRMHSEVGLKGPQLVSAHCSAQVVQAHCCMFS
jgi:hypothetical protein